MTATIPATSSGGSVKREGVLVRIAIGFTAWAERWFPDAFIFVAIAVVVVAAAALINGASPVAVSVAFGNGFWSLITFTMQMAFVAIGGYVVATSAPAQRLIGWLADLPSTGVRAVGLVAFVSMLASLLNWGLSLIFGGFWCARSRPGANCGWTTGPRRRRPIWGWARPGRWACPRRPHSCRPMRRACRRASCRSPASFHSPRRSSCGSRW